MIPVSTRWSDNTTEDYFLDLLVNKHVVNREIHDLIDIVEKSSLHPDYQFLIKQTLFGEKNIYIENWGTLESSLNDIIKTINIRENRVKEYGVVLQTMLRVVEEVCNVDNEHMHNFLMSEEKEDIEHGLIILMKRVLDFIEAGLKEMLTNIHHLDQPIVNGEVRKECNVIQDTLAQYSSLVLESEWKHIRELKLRIDTVVHKNIKRKKDLARITR
jgi:hypothetical protein